MAEHLTAVNEIYNSKSGELSGILLGCLHQKTAFFPEDKLTQLSEGKWEQLIQLAIEHRIAPIFYERLISNYDLPAASENAVEKLKAYNKEVAFKNLIYTNEFQKLLVRFNEENIPVIPLKGIYLAAKVYPHKGLRDMLDMDLMVHKHDLQRVYEILMDHGFSHDENLDFETVLNKQSHHIIPLTKGPQIIEIHWNITRPGRFYYISPDKLWQRSRVTEFEACKITELSPEDFLLHLCVHNSYQHNFSFGLRPYYDIVQVVDYFGDSLNWQQLLEITNHNNWNKGVFLSLLIAKRLLGANISEEKLKELEPLDFTHEIYETALLQVVTSMKESYSVPNTMVTILSENDRTETKLKSFADHIFISKSSMAARYEVSRSSPMIYFYYITRFFRLSFKYVFSISNKPLGRNSFVNILNRKKALGHWIREG